MAITDELREWARNNTVQDKVLTTYPVQHPVHGTVESLLRIADRIDTEHEHEMEERADRYSELRAKMNNCYIELPKDADGEPIHIGDLMEWVPYDSSYPSVIRKVVAVGACVFFAWSDEKHGYAQYEACAYRHHPAPTVEDVLWDMHVKLDEVAALHADEPTDSDERERDVERILAEYAAKLQLRGDAE